MADHITPTKDRAAGAFKTLRNITRTPVTHLAANVLETSRTTVHNKLNGSTPLTWEEIDILTDYFEVPAFVFLMGPTEILDWMASSGWSDQPGRVNPCEPEWADAA